MPPNLLVTDCWPCPGRSRALPVDFRGVMRSGRPSAGRQAPTRVRKSRQANTSGGAATSHFPRPAGRRRAVRGALLSDAGPGTSGMLASGRGARPGVAPCSPAIASVGAWTPSSSPHRPTDSISGQHGGCTGTGNRSPADPTDSGGRPEDDLRPSPAQPIRRGPGGTFGGCNCRSESAAARPRTLPHSC